MLAVYYREPEISLQTPVNEEANTRCMHWSNVGGMNGFLRNASAGFFSAIVVAVSPEMTHDSWYPDVWFEPSERASSRPYEAFVHAAARGEMDVAFEPVTDFERLLTILCRQKSIAFFCEHQLNEQFLTSGSSSAIRITVSLGLSNSAIARVSDSCLHAASYNTRTAVLPAAFGP